MSHLEIIKFTPISNEIIAINDNEQNPTSLSIKTDKSASPFLSVISERRITRTTSPPRTVGKTRLKNKPIKYILHKVK